MSADCRDCGIRPSPTGWHMCGHIRVEDLIGAALHDVRKCLSELEEYLTAEEQDQVEALLVEAQRILLKKITRKHQGFSNQRF
jgi:hypothetical protein